MDTTIAVPDDVDDLLTRWIAGDEKAGSEIYRRYYSRVLAFASRIWGRAVDAEDLAQQAMVSGLEGIRAGQKPDRLTQWLMGIVRNTARKEHQKGKGTGRLRIDVEDRGRRSEATEIARAESQKLMEQVFEKLPMEQRRLLELRYLKKQTRKQVADKFGISTEALDKRVDKIFGELRARLSRHFTTLIFTEADKRPVTREAIDRLRPSFREVFELRHRFALEPAAIAERLALPVTTVEARLKYAYETLGCGPEADLRALWLDDEAPESAEGTL